MNFEWDDIKNAINKEKHGVSFELAGKAFFDKNRVIAKDIKHSTKSETRYFCYGEVAGHILTVRFTIRGNNIRIFGAGYWREGRSKYYEQND
jgi:uncharacterized DUF497 family protein